MGLVWTGLLNGMLGLGAYWAARHGLRQPGGLTRGLAAATLAWAWATLGMEVLGAAGWLALTPLSLWTALGLLVGLGLRHADRRPVDPPVGPPGGDPWSWDAVVALGLLLWAASFVGACSLLLPVKVVSDGPIYHLYFAARWWKEGRLSLIAAPFGETAATYFPAVGDLWFAWLMTSWGGDRLAKVGQAPFWAASAMAAYAMARQLGAHRSPALVATTWFATSAPLFLFAFEPNVDMIFVAGYLVAALFFLRYALGDARAATLAVGALAAGGALGTKAIGIVFVPVLLGLAALAVALGHGTRRRAKLGHVAILLTMPAVMAGFWYGRNALLTGNPLYPLHLEAGGRAWLAGWYGPEAMRLSPYYIPRGEWRALWDIVLAVLDPRLAPLWVGAIAGVWALGAPGSPANRAVWACAGLAVANVALYWLLIPYRTQQRFMLQGLGVAVVPLARLLDRARWLRVASVGLLGVHLLTPGSWPFAAGTAPWDLSRVIPKSGGALMSLPRAGGGRSAGPPRVDLAGAAVLAALAAGSLGVAWAWSRIGGPPTRRGLLRATAASLGLAGVALAVSFPYGLDPRGRSYPPFPDYYAGWLELESRVGASGARIAYAGTNLPYYLMGAGLRNEVRYVNVDAHRDWLMHDYHREARARGRPTWPGPRPGWDRIQPDYDAWLANLRAERIQVLVVAKANPAEGRHNVADRDEFPVERQWADSHPETFVPLYGVAEHDPRFRIYGVRPPGHGTGSR